MPVCRNLHLVGFFFIIIVPFMSKMTGGQEPVIYSVMFGTDLGKIHIFKASY